MRGQTLEARGEPSRDAVVEFWHCGNNGAFELESTGGQGASAMRIKDGAFSQNSFTRFASRVRPAIS